MSGIINLLPDSLANQIAAGEVVQRPASVVKELMENSIDAGSKKISLVIKDSGKTLIHVIDDGKGMSETDARMCFERHATSKISSSDDLFKINSLGFRGEALASIAAIAYVGLKTKLINDNIGTEIVLEGSKVKRQEVCQIQGGTSVAVKNLFYNVPARRKFLKSDPVELKHILEEFARLSLPHPEVYFTAHHNDNELYHFRPSNLRQRIANYFGKNTNEKIIPVLEETDFVKVSGFVGRPELIKKSRGDQYLFVNKRYIKSNYLNHAIKMAYENLIPQNHFPFYFLMLEVDPGMIDVNIHPTKQEIKFENERLIYNLVRVAVKHALGRYSIAPSIDFTNRPIQSFSVGRKEGLSSSITSSEGNRVHTRQEKGHWSNFYENLYQTNFENVDENIALTLQSNWTKGSENEQLLTSDISRKCFQMHNNYIISPIKSGVIVIDQQAAHERVLYERYIQLIKEKSMSSQKCLFPETIQLDPKNSILLEQVLEKLKSVGFNIEKFGKNTFVINAVPSSGLNESPSVFIDNYVSTLTKEQNHEENLYERIAISMAVQASIKRGKELVHEEMIDLIDQLFACEMPYVGPTGRKCFVTFGLDELQTRFKN